jgi:hypothetical protein
MVGQTKLTDNNIVKRQNGMSKILTLIIIVFISTSCNRLTERHYENSDTTSGGFMDVQLDLNADKTLNLIRIDQKEVSQNGAGTTYEPETLFIAGTWEVSGDKICCDIKESEEFIGDAFFKSNFKTKDIMQNYNQIIFPLTTDTIYIYGQPCIATKTTNR